MAPLGSGLLVIHSWQSESDDDEREENDDAMDESDGEGHADGESGDGYVPRRAAPAAVDKRRHVERHNAQRVDPSATICVAWLSELFGSSFFVKVLDPALIYAQLGAVVDHHLQHILEHEGGLVQVTSNGDILPPPGARGLLALVRANGQRANEPRAWTTDGVVDGRWPAARRGPLVAARAGMEGGGPAEVSVLITPGRRRLTKGGTPEALAHLELYNQANLVLAGVLEQLLPHQRAPRCLAELVALRRRACGELGQLPTERRLQDVKYWRTLTQRLLRSPHLHHELEHVLERFDGLCQAVLDGDVNALGEDTSFEQLCDVFKEAPVVRTMQEAGWLRVGTERNPRGRWHVNDQRPTLKARGKGSARRGKQAAPVRPSAVHLELP